MSLTVNGSHTFGHQTVHTLDQHSTMLLRGTGTSFGYLLSYLSKWFRTMTDAWPCSRLVQLNIRYSRKLITPVWLTRKVTILISGLGYFILKSLFIYLEDQTFRLTSQHTQIYTWCRGVNNTLKWINSSWMDNLEAGVLLLWVYSNLSQIWSKPTVFSALLKQIHHKSTWCKDTSPITPTWKTCATNT